MLKKSPDKHIPVLLKPIMDCFVQPQAQFPNWNSNPDTVFVDGTFGRGGHTRAILTQFPQCKVLAFDQDEEAIEYARENFSDFINAGRLELVHANYCDLPKYLNGKKIWGCLLDLGVSSPQLDDGERGFSFYHDGPLDMRMDRRMAVNAADIVNTWPEKDLSDLFFQSGEIRHPGRVVRAIIHDRIKAPYATTRQLAGMIERVEGWKKKGSHPATNYFLALRLEVNQELTKLAGAIENIKDHMNEGGRIAVITFHSLEDRIVKVTFKKFFTESIGILVNKKVIVADEEELELNPRSRSAKLRIFQKQKFDKIEKSKYRYKKDQDSDE